MGTSSPTSKRRRSSFSFILYSLLRWLSYTVLAASAVAIICMLALRLVPSPWGWGFLSFWFLTILSAIVTCISTSPSTNGFCYPLHMFLLITSTSIQGAVFLLFMTRPDTVLYHLQSNRSDYDGRILLKVIAALLSWTFCVHLVILAMACIMHYCEPTDYYEDIEDSNKTPVHRGSRRLSRVQEESIVEEVWQKKNASDSEASRLHKEMKDKYSQQQETFDNVDI